MQLTEPNCPRPKIPDDLPPIHFPPAGSAPPPEEQEVRERTLLRRIFAVMLVAQLYGLALFVLSMTWLHLFHPVIGFALFAGFWCFAITRPVSIAAAFSLVHFFDWHWAPSALVLLPALIIPAYCYTWLALPRRLWARVCGCH